MRSCIIHVGMRKTGSTSIQKSLYGFENEDFIYANINEQSNHGPALYSLVADDPGQLSFHRKPKRQNIEISKYIGDVEKSIEKNLEYSSGRTIIFSGEVCSYLFKEEELFRLKKYLDKYFDNIKIIGYIRPPAAYINSNFQERTKDSAHEIDLQKDFPRYIKWFTTFDDIFDKANVELLKFSSDKLYKKCAVSDFCQRLGIEFPPEKVIRINESLSREAVSLLYQFRKFGIEYGARKMTGPHNSWLVGQLSKIGKSKFRFSPEIIRPVLEKNQADIQWMESRLGESLNEDLGEDNPGDVCNEQDLLTCTSETAAELLALLGHDAPKGIYGETPEEIAFIVYTLKNLVRPGMRKIKRSMSSGLRSDLMEKRHGNFTVINAETLLNSVKKETPGVLKAMPYKKAGDLVDIALKHIGRALVEKEGKDFSFQGLGRFRKVGVILKEEEKGRSNPLMIFNPYESHEAVKTGLRDVESEKPTLPGKR